MVTVKSANVDKEANRKRLDNEIAKIGAELKTVDARLRDKAFVERAPAPVVEEHRRRLRDFSAQLAKLERAREGLN
jgi:valyl-tRNA synthetase